MNLVESVGSASGGGERRVGRATASSEISSGNQYRAQPACALPRPSYAALVQSFLCGEKTSLLPPIGKQCHRSAVLTIIFAPSSTIQQIASLLGSCLVVAGDRKTAKDSSVDGRIDNHAIPAPFPPRFSDVRTRPSEQNRSAQHPQSSD
ncbi:hypothetical protein AB1Y20_018446 [Prymnesium parvum]|uniref:Uncharacterized protein n=1 Tax=Prymnesium parvum TaxID=97485 RepID=A0AB34JRR9_PRYPA